MSHIGKAVQLNDTTREIFKFVIPEPIPTTALYVLLTKDGYLFFDESPTLFANGEVRIPSLAMFTYYDIEIED